MDKLLYFSTVRPLWTKFCTLTHIGPPNPKECSKNKFSKNPIWWTAAILKNVKCDISTAVPPILMKFGMMMHLSPINLMGNEKFQNFKIQDSGGDHLENRKIVISPKPLGRFC